MRIKSLKKFIIVFLKVLHISSSKIFSFTVTKVRRTPTYRMTLFDNSFRAIRFACHVYKWEVRPVSLIQSSTWALSESPRIKRFHPSEHKSLAFLTFPECLAGPAGSSTRARFVTGRRNVWINLGPSTEISLFFQNTALPSKHGTSFKILYLQFEIINEYNI